MKPFNIPGIVVVGKHKGRRGWLIDAQCDKKYYLTVSVELHGGVWQALDAATGEILSWGWTVWDATQAAMKRWRQEIDAKAEHENRTGIYWYRLGDTP